jgi:hypothetical protein
MDSGSGRRLSWKDSRFDPADTLTYMIDTASTSLSRVPTSLKTPKRVLEKGRKEGKERERRRKRGIGVSTLSV